MYDFGTQVTHQITAAAASSTTFNPSYGYLMWLNGKTSGLQPSGKKIIGPFLPGVIRNCYIYTRVSENPFVNRR
jgi:hypothetical protein